MEIFVKARQTSQHPFLWTRLKNLISVERAVFISFTLCFKLFNLLDCKTFITCIPIKKYDILMRNI